MCNPPRDSRAVSTATVSTGLDSLDNMAKCARAAHNEDIGAHNMGMAKENRGSNNLR